MLPAAWTPDSPPDATKEQLLGLSRDLTLPAFAWRYHLTVNVPATDGVTAVTVAAGALKLVTRSFDGVAFKVCTPLCA